MLHLVETVLEMLDLGRQRTVAKHQRRVGKADRDLAQVLHFDDRVDGPIEVRQRRSLGNDGRVILAHPGQLPQARNTVGRASEEQHVVWLEDVVTTGVDQPGTTSANGDDPHAGDNRQFERGQRTIGEMRSVRPPPPDGRPPRRR